VTALPKESPTTPEPSKFSKFSPVVSRRSGNYLVGLHGFASLDELHVYIDALETKGATTLAPFRGT
jgi:hypothetical protein